MAPTALIGLIDSHAHLLHMKSKGLDVPAVLNECFTAGMTGVLDVGVDLAETEERSALAVPFQGILRAHGLYPSQAERDDTDIMLQSLAKELERDHRVVAVGEIGLDYHWNYGTVEKQLVLFQRQLELAKDLLLPVIIHNRDADNDVIDSIQAADLPSAGVMHCFSGDVHFARRCLDLGFYLSFAGNATFKNAETLREVVRFAPPDRILVETDSPYLTPHPLRGRTNHPGLIVHTYERIAAERAIPLEILSKQVRENFNSLFRTHL